MNSLGQIGESLVRGDGSRALVSRKLRLDSNVDGVRDASHAVGGFRISGSLAVCDARGIVFKRDLKQLNASFWIGGQFRISLVLLALPKVEAPAVTAKLGRGGGLRPMSDTFPRAA